MVKFAASLAIAALVAAPAFASISWDDLETRDVSDIDFFGRELTASEAAVYIREMDELFTRLPSDAALADMSELERRNFFKKLWRGIKNIGKKVIGAVLRREEGDELLGRDFSDEELEARDLDLDLDLVERDYDDAQELTAREYPIYERSYYDADEDLSARDYAEFDELD
ncbi:hypothetical protein NLJ89_g9687 [Agrocybe chaxingu]|uniref:Uncharacterized protein n=1 Tax=Agrocybe chaxingu TaxID=84603 RepID=A0A9W8JT38_9AGAR|nr:hypothetical protein NLJ89_g9687 [Agrocybe chaxingu]